ncbi:MAG: SpoIIE family protein phosphatase [Leptospirales bacterium]|nr:SpoIIE family protein phosphatase [Leptospirales bacterium]
MRHLLYAGFALGLIASTPLRAERPVIEILADGRWTKTAEAIPNFGLSSSQVKGRFLIQNASANPVTQIIEVETPWIDSIVMQAEHDNSLQRAGDSIDFQSRSVFHRNPAFILTLAGNESKYIYLTVESRGPIMLPIQIWSPGDFRAKSQVEYALLGIYFGSIFALLIYNVVLFSIGRDLSYFYYCCYLVSVLLSYLLMTGFILQFIKHDSYWLNNEGLMVITNLGFAGMCGFNRRFLESWKLNPGLDAWIKFLSIASAILAVLSFFIPYQLSVRIVNVLLPLVVLSLTINALFAALRGETLARYFLFAWLTLIAGSMAEFATNVGLIAGGIPGQFGIQLGTFVEVLLFSSALGKRIRTLYIERTRANLRLKEISRDLELARQIQQTILPAQPPAIDSGSIASTYLPLQAIGGDFYDFHFEDSRHFGVLIADVTGHGVPAALDSSTVKIAFRNERSNLKSPNVVLENMSRSLRRLLDYRFVSACYMYFDLDRGLVELSSAGHPPPILQRDGVLHTLETEGPLLGLQESPEYHTAAIGIRNGDRIVLYTDGVYEDWPEMDESEDARAWYQAMVAQIQSSSRDFPTAMLEAIRRLRKNSPFSDDVTILSVEIGAIHPETNAPSVAKLSRDQISG